MLLSQVFPYRPPSYPKTTTASPLRVFWVGGWAVNAPKLRVALALARSLIGSLILLAWPGPRFQLAPSSQPQSSFLTSFRFHKFLTFFSFNFHLGSS